VGLGLRDHGDVVTRIFKSLSAADVAVQLLTTSEIKVSVLIDDKQLAKGVKILHQAFDLDKNTTEAFDPIVVSL